jgi:hypothetical protein
VSLLAYALLEASEVTLPASVTAAEKERYINAATLRIERYCGRAFVTRSVTEQHSAGPNGYRGGLKLLVPFLLPVAAVASITDDASQTVPAADFAIWKNRGLEHVSCWPAPLGLYGGGGKWTLVYTAGEYATIAAVPADVKEAAQQLVRLFAAKQEANVRAVTVGNLSISYGGQAEMLAGLPAEIASLLSGYRFHRSN